MKRTLMAAPIMARALLLAACGGGGGGDANKAGGDAAPMTLRIATDDQPGRPAAAQVEEFAR